MPEYAKPKGGELGRLVAGLPHDEVIERYEGGEPVSRIVSTLRDRGVQVSADAVEEVLDRHQVIRHVNPGVIPRGAPQGLSAESARVLYWQQLFEEHQESAPRSTQGEHPLSERRLRLIAKRHAEGKGKSITYLAKRSGVSVYAMRQALVRNGYIASTHWEWTERTLNKMANDIARMYHNERKSVEYIRVLLLRHHGLSVSTERLRKLLLDAGVTLRPLAPADQHFSSEGKVTQSALQDHARWSLPSGHEKELARRILDDGESVKNVADELGVDHNWLATSLKKAGYLPDVNLNRLRKQMRLRMEKGG